ncbi:MAG: hypothetical protein U0T74_10415 [Chitinophagales bacterium]
MKFLFRCGILVLAICLALGSVASAQRDTVVREFEGFKSTKLPLRQNVIKSNLIPFLFGQIPICGEIRFTYERMLSHNQSLTLGASYNYPNLFLFVMPAIANPNGTTLKDYSLRGGRITLGYRFYPLKSKQAPEGLFVGPYGSFNFVKIKERNGNGSSETWCYANGSLIAGYQFYLTRGVFLELFGGLGYRKNFIVYYDAVHNRTSQADLQLFFKNNPFKNVKLIFQLNLGFGW